MIRNHKMRVELVLNEHSLIVTDNCNVHHLVRLLPPHIVSVDGNRYTRYRNHKSTGAKYLRVCDACPKRITDVCPGFDFRYIAASLWYGYPVNST